MRLYRGNKNKNYYIAGFLYGVSMRENCYDCNYARPDRVSDITIGDFIGLGKKAPFDYPKKNVSSVTTNTSKGYNFYMEALNSMPELMSVERDYSERLEYKPSLLEPFERHPLNPTFRENYLKYGYLKAIRKTLRWTMFRNRILSKFKYWNNRLKKM